VGGVCDFETGAEVVVRGDAVGDSDVVAVGDFEAFAAAAIDNNV